MTNDQLNIPIPIASRRDRLARFALQQMEESGFVEKEATQTQPHGYDVLTEDKAMAPVLAALYFHLGTMEAVAQGLGFSAGEVPEWNYDRGLGYIEACKELAKKCDPDQIAGAVADIMRTISDDEKRRLVGKLRFASNDPGVRWFLRTYLDTKPISWQKKISAAVELHLKGLEKMKDASIPLSEKMKILEDPKTVPVKLGQGRVVTIKCLQKSDLIKFRKIPRFDECQDLLVSCEVPLTWGFDGPTITRDDICYVSHKWDDSEPDPQQLILLAASKIKGDFLLWIDYCCIDQQDPDFEHIVSAMSVIPHVIFLSMTTLYDHYLLGLLSERHSMSAWCQLEHALKPREFKRPLGLQLTKTIVLHGERSLTTFLDALSSLFFDREDVSTHFKAMVLQFCSDLTLRLNTGETQYFEDFDED